MAGVTESIRIEYDDTQLQQALQKLASIGGDMAPAMLEISEYLHEQTRERFDDETAPDGTPWAPLAPQTIEDKLQRGVPINKVLHADTLHLRDTMQSFHSATEAGISTGMATSKYAATHQFGDESRNIPDRPYFGLSDEDEREILAIINDHLDITR